MKEFVEAERQRCPAPAKHGKCREITAIKNENHYEQTKNLSATGRRR